jgi:hypothetical protein
MGGSRSTLTAAAPQKQAESVADRPEERVRGRLARWITCCLLAWAALDVVPRLLPVAWLHILPEHVVTRRPGKYYPFQPNQHLRYDPWVGETAMEGNLAPTEIRAPIDFSTDRLGFRLTPGVAPGSRIDLLLFSGASFAYGGGLSDDETLPAVMTRDAGLRMYNGGHFWWDPENFTTFEWLADQFPGQHPVVVLLEWEQMNHRVSEVEGTPWKPDRIGTALLGRGRYWPVRTEALYLKRRLNAMWNISPLEVLSIRLFKRLSNDRILPNRYRDNVAPFRTARGDRLLFLNEEVNRVKDPPSDAMVARQVAYFREFQRRLAGRGLRTYVLLIPNKYTLYGRLVDAAAPRGPRYLDRLESALEQAGVPVLNGLTVLEPYAPGDLNSGETSMYREDHHWSPKGVRILGAALAARLRAEGILNRDRSADALQ